MLLRAQPIFDAFDAIERKIRASFSSILLENSLIRLMLKIWLKRKSWSLSVGTTRGYDERIKTLVTDEISLGDYVLTGGELAAMTMIDATVRLIPEVIGKGSLATKDDSFLRVFSNTLSTHVPMIIEAWLCQMYWWVAIMKDSSVAPVWEFKENLRTQTGFAWTLSTDSRRRKILTEIQRKQRIKEKPMQSNQTWWRNCWI